MGFMKGEFSIYDRGFKKKLWCGEPMEWETLDDKEIKFEPLFCNPEWVQEVEKDGVVEQYVYIGFELKCRNISIGPFVEPSDKIVVVTVGKSDTSKSTCLLIPKKILESFDGIMIHLLYRNKRVHYNYLEKEELVNIAHLFAVHNCRFREIFDFSPERLFQIGLLYKELLRPYHSMDDSLLRPFIGNLENMRKVDTEKEFENIRTLLIPLPEDPIMLSIPLSKLLVPELHNLCKKGYCNLQIFRSNYGKVDYFGFSLSYSLIRTWEGRKVTEVRQLVDFDIILVFIGDNGQVLEFYILNQPGDARFGFGNPTLVKISDLEKIGLNGDGVKLEVRAGEYRDPTQKDAKVVTFVGLTDYTIETEKMIINVNKNVLGSNSLFFNALHNSDFIERGDNTGCLPHEDDPEALVLLFEMVYGSSFPIDFLLLTRLMILANKYLFINLVRYFDLILLHLAQKKQLPQSWFEKADAIISAFNLNQLKDYFDYLESRKQSYVSIAKPEDNHRKMLLWLNVIPPTVEEIFDDWLRWNFQNDDTF